MAASSNRHCMGASPHFGLDAAEREVNHARMQAITRGEIEALGQGFAGQVLEPGDAGYDEARTIWNGAIDRKPAIIARCATASDVARAIRWAMSSGIYPAVRSGGHGVGGLALVDDGLVIALSHMKAIEVD